MKSKNSLFLLLVVALTVISGVGYYFTKFQYGLDVKGGIRLTYQMDMSSLSSSSKADISTIQSNLKRILDSRVAGIGVSEGNVYPKGDDQFVVELPGYTDVDTARQVMSTTAKIQVYWAKTVGTKLKQGRYNEIEGQEGSGSAPFIAFTNGAGKKLVPSDPDYKEMVSGWDLLLEGEDVTDAKAFVNGTMTIPEFTFGGKGAENLEQFCRQNMNKGEKIAFVLDGTVLNIAPVKDGAILKDQAEIEGKFDVGYVKRLTDLVKSGSLPVKLTELASQQVDPTIGNQALSQIVIAAAIALGITALYLIFYYAFPGGVATIAMLLYTLFTLTVLKLMGATFSLAAIAGFVLSAAMAVDANILVFERIKEEVKNGKRLSTAIDLGFRRALTAIIDSNLSTLLTSVVLYIFGTGAVRGFALTLIIGVIISFFTAITVTRSLLVGINAVGLFTDIKWFAINRKWFFEKQWEKAGTVLKVISQSKRYFLISAIAIVPGVIALFAGGLKPNVEFQGGFEAEYTLKSDISGESIRRNLQQHGMPGANVKFATVGTSKAVYVTLPPNKNLDIKDTGAKDKIAQAGGIEFDKGSVSAVGPTIQKEMIENAVKSVVFSSALIVLLLAFRFGASMGGVKNGVKFGASAVAALLHDVLFVFGTAAICGFIFGWEVSALFITAMLTVIGFSVHDTIVIFDRIRENLMKPFQGDDLEHIVDKSITQSFARSLNTSMTAMGTLVVLIIAGTPTPELKFMCTVMFLGILVGTYSSIYNASPILYLWDKAILAKKGTGFGLVADALKEAKNRALQAARTPVTIDTPGPVHQSPKPVDPSVDPNKASLYGQVRRRRSVIDDASRDADE